MLKTSRIVAEYLVGQRLASNCVFPFLRFRIIIFCSFVSGDALYIWWNCAIQLVIRKIFKIRHARICVYRGSHFDFVAFLLYLVSSLFMCN